MLRLRGEGASRQRVAGRGRRAVGRAAEVRRWPLYWLAAVLLLALAGCSRPEGVDTGTPSVTPTSESTSNQLRFAAPYRAVLDAGETVPGAELQYVGKSDDGIHVRIEGQDAYKKVGDSFNWQGSPAPGVELDYSLRVMGVYVRVFQAWGEVGIAISDPVPVVTEVPEEAPLTFSFAVADYTVAEGESIPGTTYTYLGDSEKGAEFGGVEGYAYREIADSLDWSGQVRDNVYVDLTMRVRSIQEDEVKLVGTATVWIFP